MTLLFDRAYKLQIGKPKNIVYKTGASPLTDSFTNVGWQDGIDWRASSIKNAVELVDLQMTASIKSSSNNATTTGSSAVITISNMAKETRNIVENVNNYVILNAGYKQEKDLRTIFVGQVESFITDRVGQNLVTTLKCKDGYSINNSIRVSKTFSKDKTYADVIFYLAEVYASNGVPTGDIIDDWGDDANADRTINNNKVVIARADPQDFVQLPVILAKPAKTKLGTGYSVVGYLHQVLETLCSQIGYVSYITNGKLFIHPKGFTKTVEEYEFSSNIMKSIRKTASKTTGSSLGSGLEGVKITTFLDGRLDTDKRIKITDGDYQGSYKIIEKEVNLDFENGAWDSIVTCKSSQA